MVKIATRPPRRRIASAVAIGNLPQPARIPTSSPSSDGSSFTSPDKAFIVLVTTLYLAISKHSVRILVLFKSDLMLLSRRTLLLTIESSAPILQLV